MKQEELNLILEKHKKWLNNEEGGEKANLSNADLTNADLTNADLKFANLYNADLTNANLSNADLENISLYQTKLDEKEQIRLGLILTKKMIGYKKCQNDMIVKLEIPKGAIVFSINNGKCRTNKAKVLEISENSKVAYSLYNDNKIKYQLGKTYEIKNFNLQYNVECAEGIHFFRTKKEAKEYVYYHKI